MNQQEVLVYSKPNCPSCLKAKALLDNMHITYKTLTLGTDIQPSEMLESFAQRGLPQPKTAPQIFIGDQLIGGYEALVSYVDNTGWNGTGSSLG
jgi:glutaredoxin 3|tara:strand:+ start:436 stop:717 length:282 start_codon:yes stop_codon:yes gene_type:complete